MYPQKNDLFVNNYARQAYIEYRIYNNICSQSAEESSCTKTRLIHEKSTKLENGCAFGKLLYSAGIGVQRQAGKYIIIAVFKALILRFHFKYKYLGLRFQCFIRLEDWKQTSIASESIFDCIEIGRIGSMPGYPTYIFVECGKSIDHYLHRVSRK